MLKKLSAVIVIAGILCGLSILPAFAEDVFTPAKAPLSPEYLRWLESINNRENLYRSSAEDTGGYAAGYIPDPVDYSHLAKNPPRRAGNEDILRAENLPVSYDLRDYGRVTSVKNQNPYGTCWTLGALGAMESNYLTQNMGTDIDLSELYMAWFCYKDSVAENNFTPYYPSRPVLDYGGYPSISIAYLSRLSGPVSEDTLPYSTAGSIKSTSDSTMTSYINGRAATDFAPASIRLKETYSLGHVSGDNRATIMPVIKDLS